MSNQNEIRHYNYHGWIRRIDLVLRARYPNLITRIFETSPNQYIIWFPLDLLDAVATQEEFAQSIRFVTTNATISNDIPDRYSLEIPPLGDDEIARGYAGIPMTLPELGNLLAARFPDLPILRVWDGGQPMMITVDLTAPLAPADEKVLLEFCSELEAIVPWKLNVVPADRITQINTDPVIQTPDKKMPFPTPDPLAIRATRMRPYLPNYAKRDEAFWFDNIDAIYSGRLQVEDISGVVQNQSQCFMDLTVGDHVNLRQALMLYDTVYVSPPLLEGHEIFLQKQHLTEADLLTLIEQGRLRIVSTQAEERLNIKFLEAASERHATAIIGRRSTAALLIADLVRTADEYRLAKSDAQHGVTELAKLLAAKISVPVNEMLRLLLWPVEARRTALQPLHERGSKGVAPIGLAPFVARYIRRLVDKDIELEALVVSERVHIGHALNATVFPNSYEPPGLLVLMNVMADGLNFYRAFNGRIAASWAANEERKVVGKPVMPALTLFEFEPGVPVVEFLDTVRLSSTRDKGKALFGRLAELTDEQRSAEIARLDGELRRKLKASGNMLSFASLDTGISIGALLTQAAYPPVAGLLTLAIQLKEASRKIPALDRLITDIEKDLFSALDKSQEIDFLSRINRVATFKKDRIS